MINNDGINLNYFRNSFNINPRINTSSGKASYNTAMQNVSVSTDIHIWAMFLFNCLFAVLYEAFPEEVL
jgi:hypothetical protein